MIREAARAVDFPRFRLGGAWLVAGWLLAVSVAFVVPLSGESWVRGHYEGMRYLALAAHFRNAVAEGWLYPRWLPDLYGGHGYPMFVYYQPLVFWLYTAWTPIVAGTTAMCCAIGSAVLLGNTGVYLLARRFGGRLWGCLVVALFMLSPYLYVNTYVRQDLSELCSMLLVPWVFLGVLWLADSSRLGHRRLRSAALLAVAYAGVIYAHPITGVLLSIFSVPLLLSLAFIHDPAAGRPAGSAGAGSLLRWHRGAMPLRAAGLALGAGLMLAAPYWLPFLQMEDFVWLERARTGYFEATRHTVELGQLFDRQWGFGGSKPDSALDKMPLQLGACHFGLAVLGAAWSCRKPLVAGAALAYAAVIWSMTPWSEAVWRFPVLDQMQFPWRALTVATALQCLLFAALGTHRWLAERTSLRLFFGLAAIAATGLWQAEQFKIGKREPNANARIAAEVAQARHAILHYNNGDELLPKTSRFPPQRPRGDAPIVTAPGARVALAEASSAYRIAATITASADTVATIHQFFLPGWVVRVDGRRLSDRALREQLGPAGLIRVPLRVPSGRAVARFHVQAHYGGPRGASLAGLLAAGAALVLASLCLLETWGRLPGRWPWSARFSGVANAGEGRVG